MFLFEGSADYGLTRFIFQRGLGFIYFIGFLILVQQFVPLLGEKGLLPVPLFLKRASFTDAPSLFFIHFSDTFAAVLAFLGLGLAVLALTGISDNYGIWVSAIVWGLLWLLYLSFVNVGQTFYGFGWETLLLETGFLAIFLGSKDAAVPVVLIWLLRWVLFRLMFGAGLIKLRGDSCWRDLSCMMYHYETQPMPNPLSWYFHHLPPILHRIEVASTHFVEVIVPWFFFVPGIPGAVAGLVTIVFQGMLILSGNLSWLNYITIVLCISCFNDKIITSIIRIAPFQTAPASTLREVIVGTLALMIGVLSIKPARNLFSSSQIMNTSFDSLHLVNTYGAFGSITRDRMEVIVQGTKDIVITPATQWLEYEFKGKPGDPKRRPPIVSPYHLRLDWQMWFAAMNSYVYHPWIVTLVAKLLQGDQPLLGLLRTNPFPDAPPRYIRLELYHYKFVDKEDSSGNWWVRKRVEGYLPPLSLADFF